MVPQAGLEPALLSEQDFESFKRIHNLLIYNVIFISKCACVLISVLVEDSDFNLNKTARGPLE